MSNVKPGDRAIVVKSVSGPNLGKVVLVVEEYDGRVLAPVTTPYDTKGYNLCWIVESLGTPFVLPQRRGQAPILAQVSVGPDVHLRRLDDDIDTPANDSLSVVNKEIAS